MSKVDDLCGEIPENYIKEEVVNDSNFVFNPDPNYEPVLLYDIENNSVVVNSYVECEHYVSGGWNFEPLKNSEQIFQNSLFIVVTALLIITYLTNFLITNRYKNEN